MSAAGRRTAALAVAVLGVVAGLVGLEAIRSWDLWWHMATGREALATGSTLPVDVFSFTRAGVPWVYKDLGADLLFFGAYQVAGELGLALLKLGAALGLMTLLALGARRRLAPVWGWLLLAGAAFMVASFRVIARPEVFTLVALAALLILLERWRRGGSPRGWRLGAALVGLVLLWANLHRGVVLGVAILVVHAVWEMAGALTRGWGWPARLLPGAVVGAERPWHRAGGTLLVAGLAGAASLANPSGSALWAQSLAVGTSHALAVSVSEWAHLSLGELWTSFPLAVVWMVAVVVVLPVSAWRRLRRGGRLDLFDAGLAALGLVLGLSAVRFLPVMAILTLGPLAGAVAALSSEARPDGARTREAGRSATLLAGVAEVVVLALALLDPRVGAPSPGFAPSWYPEGAVAAIADAPVAGEGFTTFTFAGYVLWHLWPDKRVPCDGRYDAVYDDATIEACLLAERDPSVFEAWRQRFGLEWVLAHNRPGPPPDPHRPRAFDYLDTDPAWALVYWDAASLLYVRRAGPNASLAQERAYEVLRPHAPDVSLMDALARGRDDPALMARLEAELGRLQAAAPDDYRTFVLLALFLHGVGATDTAEFRAVVEGLRARRGDDPAAVDRVLEWIGATR